MACNNWDKLSKAQRDYPKPKFAISFVDKSLKKNPKNPFLLAWKADLSLQLNQEPKAAVSQLQQASEQPGLTDTRLLSYIYRLLLEATRRDLDKDLNISSVGNQGLEIWTNAAKPLRRKEERQQIWSELAGNAVREDCWGDFRYAVLNYSKDNATVKKDTYFTQILALQLSAAQLHRSGKDGDRLSQMQYMMALRMMKKAYEAPPNDAIAFKSIRDLRFMGKIYAGQDKCAELMQLWQNPPASLQNLMATHKDDLKEIQTRLLLQQEAWPLLEDHCLAYINDTISRTTADPDSKCLLESCSWNGHVWFDLIIAVKENHDLAEAQRIVSDITDRAFGTELQTRDRFIRLTYMSLRRFIGTTMLADCKVYWEHHSTLVTCFSDLQIFVRELSPENAADFYKFIRTQTMDTLSNPGSKEGTNVAWETIEQNITKFEYLLAISRPSEPAVQAFEDMVAKSIKYCKNFPDNSAEGSVAVYSLLNLHHRFICQDEPRNPFGITINSRVLLQATMLARHLVECDKEKQNRALALLAARLHLNLGLGKCAFRLYSHAKCKEMLVDTLAPYVLSRISLTHPFEVKGYQGFSADEELAKAIVTMDRMEKKMENIVYSDMDSFPWDQAENLLDTKRKLNSSLTKHLCVTERRRMARLKGQTIDHLQVLDFKTYHDISDNVAKNVFPQVDPKDTAGPLPYIMPNAVPNVNWFIESHDMWDASSRYLYKEGPLMEHFDAWAERAGIPHHTQVAEANMSQAELQVQPIWESINAVVEELACQKDHEDMMPAILKELKESIHEMRKAMEKLRMPGSTALKPEDEPTMFHENMLLSCYTKLEVLRALNKLVEHLREKVVNAKTSHSLKSKLPKNWVNEVESETKICYASIRDVADSYIKLIKTTGEAAIKAQVKWGKTGASLQKLLKDDDIDFYASEYADSALHAWKGVLEVKLK